MEAGGIPGEVQDNHVALEVQDRSKVSLTDGVLKLSDNVIKWFRKRNGDTLKGALAFVPWVLQQAYIEGGLSHGNQNDIVIHRGTGAVVFTSISGFIALTESLSTKSNGAELLSSC